MVVGGLPATEKRLAEIRARQLEDDVCQQVMGYRAEAKPPILAIGVEAVLASAERVDNPEQGSGS